jgi:uncharacterized protein YcfL
MKRILKLFSIVLIVILLLGGCEKEEEKNNNENKVDNTKIKEEQEKINLLDNIVTKKVAFFNGEFNDKTIILEAKNNNNRPLYLHYSFEVYDKSKVKLFNKEVIVRVGSNSSAYVVAVQDLEESSFDYYSYKVDILNDKLDDYNSIKREIKSGFNDNGKEIVVSFNNTGIRTTTVYGLLFFYKNNNIVAIKNVKSYNLMPYQTNYIKVSYPIRKINKKISFDTVKLVVNEVSTEL